MIQLTIVKYHSWNELFCTFAAELLKTEKTIDELKYLIKSWCDVYNVKYNPKWDLQEVNNCVLLYIDNIHYITIKFEL
jgi:hypothetical protein